MASVDNHHKVNGARLSQLLIDKGTEAMRNVFDRRCTPSNLTAVLTSNKSFLQNNRHIAHHQLDVLFPPSGTQATSKDFDITLLFILLRNICGLNPPASTSSWNKNPPSIDQSTVANLVRIKNYRNDVYAHNNKTGIDDVNFQFLWDNISTALISLGISAGDIKALHCAPLEEDVYLNLIREWKEKEDKLEYVLLNRMDELGKDVKEMMQSTDRDILNQLAKCNFDGTINMLNKAYHKGSRKWLLDLVDDWFTDRESDSRVMILTAGPGVGKSVFAAKVCQMYREHSLAACHFCKFNYTDLRNPKTMLESISSHMCDSVPGFKEKLTEQLCRHHSRDTITDAFRVLLNDPLHALGKQQPMMIVIDGLDESETGGKSELLDVISKEFPHLPKCVKFFITSRPELLVREKLYHFNPFEIKPGDENNDHDLKIFLEYRLADFNLEEDAVSGLVEKCQGSFLFANHLVFSLPQQLKNESSKVGNVMDCVPKSVGSVYKEYFDRLKEEFASLFTEKMEKFDVILEILPAAQGPLPLRLAADVLELPGDTRAIREVIRKVNERLSTLLYVYDDCLTVFHKSVVDWLLLKGYDDHPYSVDDTAGHRHLWLACEKKMETDIMHIKQSDRLANQYAQIHGISHLQFSFFVYFFFEIGTVVVDPVCEISAKLEGWRFQTFGWRFYQENENSYVMTTKSIVRKIKSMFDQSKQIIRTSFETSNGHKEEYFANLNDSVVVCCDEGSLLDYAVVKFRVPSKDSSRKRFTIAKQRPPPGSSLAVGGEVSTRRNGIVLPYPNHLVDFIKKSTRFYSSNYVERNAVLGSDLINRETFESNKDIFLFNNIYHISDSIFVGLPLINSDQEVVGFQSTYVFIKATDGIDRLMPRGGYTISIAICIDKIIEDIHRKIPNFAKRSFPDFFDRNCK